MMFTGVRVQELCEVKVSDVILGERSGSVVVRGKGNKQRTIPIIKDLRDTLRKYSSI
ncbi:tyrosine-type recombinase/integrase [Shimazuella sp. KC615]|uniref:Tyrosine-type recombinase/integrase n=1 Tax=Shimazuella alba TaxID=2690964 RepID=A0A6I4VVY7_9BACL|nr:tyrosine-type recombinase/integrase [Shimazuella alba]